MVKGKTLQEFISKLGVTILPINFMVESQLPSFVIKNAHGCLISNTLNYNGNNCIYKATYRLDITKESKIVKHHKMA